MNFRFLIVMSGTQDDKHINPTVFHVKLQVVIKIRKISNSLWKQKECSSQSHQYLNHTFGRRRNYTVRIPISNSNFEFASPQVHSRISKQIFPELCSEEMLVVCLILLSWANVHSMLDNFSMHNIACLSFSSLSVAQEINPTHVISDPHHLRLFINQQLHRKKL